MLKVSVFVSVLDSLFPFGASSCADELCLCLLTPYTCALNIRGSAQASQIASLWLISPC